MTTIPGLLHGPVEDDIATNTMKGLELMSFDLDPFIIPEAQKYGKCRLITEFDRIAVIDEGAYGIVYKVRDRMTDEIVALKKLKLAKDPHLPFNFMREVMIMKSLDHHNVINLLGFAVGRSFESTYIIMDFCEYQLSKIVDDDKASTLLLTPEIKYIIEQVFTGLSYLHLQFVIHRDLTTSNILFTSDGILKIADFGIARYESTEMTPNVGTRWYKSPELVFGSKTYTPAVDLWSAGCILAELILREPLFKAKSDMDLITGMIELLGTPTDSIWPGVSKLPAMKAFNLKHQPYNRLGKLFIEEPVSTISLLQKLLTYDQTKRIKAQDCLRHAYFIDQPQACHPDALVVMLNKFKAI